MAIKMCLESAHAATQLLIHLNITPPSSHCWYELQKTKQIMKISKSQNRMKRNTDS